MTTYYHQQEGSTAAADLAVITGPASDGGTVRVAIQRMPTVDPEHREHWAWRISHTNADGTRHTSTSSTAAADDIRSGAQGFGGGARPTMLALASFLGAYAEASEHGENADLFPASVDRTTAQDCADLINLTLGGYE